LIKLLFYIPLDTE